MKKISLETGDKDSGLQEAPEMTNMSDWTGRDPRERQAGEGMKTSAPDDARFFM